MLMIGIGARVGHCAQALWFEENGKRQLYVVESQDAPYWPVQRIQRTKYRKWLELAEAADFHVAFIKLSKKKHYNETAARERFFELQGLPYGVHSFLLSWLDTPELNYPYQLPSQSVVQLFSLIEKFDKNTTEMMFGTPMNMRLGTKGLNITELGAEAGRQNLTLDEVLAIPEYNNFTYDYLWHDGPAFVCTGFLTEMWRSAGVFGNLTINSAEFTPKDIY